MTTTLSLLDQLQAWYLRECNGDWEHSFGIKIETLDNPGWLVPIDLGAVPDLLTKNKANSIGCTWGVEGPGVPAADIRL